MSELAARKELSDARSFTFTTLLGKLSVAYPTIAVA
jgi:hypothetical protein